MKAAQSVDASPFPKTSLSLVTLCGRIDFIKNGIAKLAVENNIYSMKILFRSLIEHFLKLHFLFLRWASQKTDDPGKEYLQFCNLVEEANLAEAFKRQIRLEGNQLDADIFQIVRKKHPELSQVSNEEIREKSNQFTYRRIINYIAGNLYKDEALPSDAFLSRILPEYADLSSFVHGGPFANKTMLPLKEVEKLDEAVLSTAELCLCVAGAAKMFTLLFFFQNDKSYGEPYIKLHTLLETKLFGTA